jgi:hypothetical protein
VRCESNLCNQGRIPCPTRWECNTHRAFINDKDGGETVDLGGGNFYLDNIEVPVKVPGWALFLAVCAGACGLAYLVML